MTDDPAVRVYLRRLNDCPPLTPEEQLAAAKEFRCALLNFRRAMLSNDYVLKHVANCLRQALDGKRGLHRVVEIGRTDEAEKKRIPSILAGHLQRIDRLLQQNQKGFRVAVCRHAPMHQRRDAWRRLVRRRQEAGRMIEELRLRTEFILLSFRQLRELAEEMERLQDELRGQYEMRPKSERSCRLRSRLVHLMNTTLESPQTLPHRIGRVALMHREYRRAKHRLVLVNLRLVTSTAREFQRPGVSLPDLIQEGIVGLLLAVEKFDHLRGCTFATYATWWIRQAIWREIGNQFYGIPRLPLGMQRIIKRLNDAVDDFVQQHARRPTLEETAVACGLPFEEADAALRWGRQPQSLGETLRNHGDSSLAEFVRAPNGNPAKHVEHALDREVLKKSIADALRLLDDRERTVVRLRFGLSDGRPRTLRDVGKVFSVSYETVRKIQAKALTKLQTPALESLASIW